MNPMFDQVFNQQAMNQDYIQQIRINQYHAEQRQEIAKAVNAIHEYFQQPGKSHLSINKQQHGNVYV